MKPVTIALYHYRKPFVVDFGSAHGVRSNSESIIVKLDFENGITGYGECAPRCYVTGETSSSVVQVITKHFPLILFHRKIECLRDIEGTLDDLERACIDGGVPQYNSALAAIDLALMDGYAKWSKSPLHAILGPLVNTRLIYSIPVPLIPIGSLYDLYKKIEEYGFRHIKVLMDHKTEQNVERVRTIRRLFGEEADIRLEANGIWTIREAFSNLEKLIEFNISAVEEPLAKIDTKTLPTLRAKFGLAVIADESMCSLSDARWLIENEACDILNIKVSKCGGLIRSKRIAAYASANGMRCQLGAHVGETQILSAAARHLAMTFENLVYFEGISSFLYKNDGTRTELFHAEEAFPRPSAAEDQLRKLIGDCESIIRINST